MLNDTYLTRTIKMRIPLSLALDAGSRAHPRGKAGIRTRICAPDRTVPARASLKPWTSLVPPMRGVATLGGGCFWCLEAVFEQLQGVEGVVSGYAGGFVADPSYEQVCDGATGHAEVVQVTFDPGTISFRELLEVFFTIHDPTTRDRQGNDVGTQYRSIILYHSPEQRAAAKDVIQTFASKAWEGEIVTEVEPFKEFFSAESYHQAYFRNNPTQGYCRAVVAPKVAKFRKAWAHRLRAST